MKKNIKYAQYDRLLLKLLGIYNIFTALQAFISAPEKVDQEPGHRSNVLVPGTTSKYQQPFRVDVLTPSQRK